jgi:hypothetical protein
MDGYVDWLIVTLDADNSRDFEVPNKIGRWFFERVVSVEGDYRFIVEGTTVYLDCRFTVEGTTVYLPGEADEKYVTLSLYAIP